MVTRILLLIWLLPALAWAQEKIHPEVEAGNRALAKGDPRAALSHYEAAQKDLPGDPDLAFNRGGALYAQGKFQEASRAFLEATDTKDPTRRAEAFRHYGDAELRQQNLKGAIQAYKQALSLNPLDAAARHNLEVALRQAKQQQQQQQQQDQSQSQPQSQPQKEPQSQPSGQPQEQPQNENPSEQPQESPSPQGEEAKEPEEKPGQPQPEEQSSKEEPEEKKSPQQNPAEPKEGEPRKEERSSQKLLDALKAKEKSFLHEHRKRQQKGARPPVEKDW